MSKDVQKAFVTGRLTRDPETRAAGESTVTTIGVASSSSFKKNGEWVDKPNFFDVNIWGARGETIARYLSKGDQVIVEGRLDYQSWEKDGEKRSKIVVVADNVVFGARAKADTDTPPF